MARHPDFIHSATSQFFINLVDNLSLDHRPSDDDTTNGYCVFGEVIEGMEVVDKISSVAVHDRGGFVKTPVEPVMIESITRVK
jgi:peptidyl-prolyl cis-trans isomerase B (cyclophilin B)